MKGLVEMSVGTVKTGESNKKLSICLMNKRKVSGEHFDEALSTLLRDASVENRVIQAANFEPSGDAVLDVLKNKGRVYGIYQKKELVALYIYERIDDFFIKNKSKDSDEKTKTSFQINDVKRFFNMTDDDISDFDDWLWGENKAVYRLVSKYFSDAAKAYQSEIEKCIVADLKAQIEWGQISGILMGEKLIYRKNLEKNGASDHTLGSGAGFTIGVIFGWLVFDSISLGFLWGICFAAIGGLISTNSATKQEWTTFDFINKKYIGAKEEK
jgi:hypothetical protein